MNTLIFNLDQFYRTSRMREWFTVFVKNCDGDDEFARAFIEYVLMLSACETATTVWCRRGSNFTAELTADWWPPIRKASNEMTKRFGPSFHPRVYDIAYRMSKSLQEYTVNFRELFTIYNQWYEQAVALPEKQLSDVIQELTMVIVSSEYTDLHCTFKPWALYTETGVVTFINK